LWFAAADFHKRCHVASARITTVCARTARKELRAYDKRGPRGATARLLRLVQAAAPDQPSLLDIGGGVGVIPQELLKAGASRVTSVDASEAYHATTRSIASEHGYADRWTSVMGDFVERAADLAPADVVTLDKVICCYPDMPVLVTASATRARKLYGIVVPKDGWWVRAAARVGNLALRVLRFEFQGFVHPLANIDAAVEGAGLTISSTASYWIWSIRLYARNS
jgi:magnesium-protoporphyrin O-methyltransferase